jgi:hypothetical protein
MERVKEGAAKLSIADMKTVLGWGWNEMKLAEEIVRLDYELIPGMDEKDEGTPEQWTGILAKWPQTWRLMVSGASTIVGYWHFVPLKREYFDMAVQGRLLDSKITEDMLVQMDGPGSYDIYWVMMGITRKLQGTGAYEVLFGSFLSSLEELAERGIFVRNICDNSYAESGSILSDGMGGKLVAKHVSRGSVYAGKLYPFPEQLAAFSSHPRLARLYSDHFGNGLGSLLKK